jgi:tRNA pseudouridine65 synthase
MRPKLALPVLYKDEALVIVDKPSGLVVHRGWGTDRVVAMTIVRNQLRQHVHPVHRLDRGTSGVLVFALDAAIAAPLHAAFEEGRATKRYLALVRGIAPEGGVIDSPVPRSPDGPRVPALTEFRRLAVFERFSLVEAIPRTGRLHQIRRHLKHIGHPLVGDVNYGKGDINRAFRERFGLRRLALHALSLEIEHPADHVPIRVSAPLPEDLAGPYAQMQLPTSF